MKSRVALRVRAGLLLLAAASVSGGLVGCRVNADDLEQWKGTLKGPAKIAATLLADKYSMELRTRAALALVEMERTDHDGVAELDQAIARLAPEVQTQILSGLVPGLETAMGKGVAPSGPPTPLAARAKDAAFQLINYASPELKTRLTDDVIGWYVADFSTRNLAGKNSAEQVVRALGSPAAAALVAGIQPRLPQQALVKLAQLVGEIAEPAARKAAAERLVAAEQEIDSPAFLAWVEQTVREQATRANRVVEAGSVAKTALKMRESLLTEGALPAMKFLADEPIVKQRLLAVTATTRVASDPDDLRRQRALAALEGKVSREDLSRMMGLALDAKNPEAVRDLAFDRVGDIRSPDALPQLWPLVGSAGNDRLRWRAGELVLAIGGPKVIADFAQRLPGGDTRYPPEELEGYATRMGQMTPLPSVEAKTLLGSSAWYLRVVALQFFARKGTAAEIKALTALRGDGAKVVGPRWGMTKTVGQVAAEAEAAGAARLAGSLAAGPGI